MSARSVRRTATVIGLSAVAVFGAAPGVASAAPTSPPELSATSRWVDDSCQAFTIKNTATQPAGWSTAAYWQKMVGIQQTYIVPPLAAGASYTVYKCGGPGARASVEQFVGDQEFWVDYLNQVGEINENNNRLSF